MPLPPLAPRPSYLSAADLLPSCCCLRTTLSRPAITPARLHGLGYADISHSGYVCDERWYSITYGVR